MNESTMEMVEETRRFAHDLRAPVMALQSLLGGSSAAASFAGAEGNEVDPIQWGEPEEDLLSKSTQRLLEMSLEYLDYCKKKARVSDESQRKQAEDLVSSVGLLEIRKLLRESVHEVQSFSSSKIQWSLRDFLSLQAVSLPGGSNVRAHLKCQPGELRRVLVNLLQNAAEACEGQADATAVVSAYVDGEHLQIEIQDNGEGMCPDTLRHAFEGKSFKPFGNGLGLSQAQRSLKAWKSKMQIDSRVGRGTTVMLSFPLSQNA
jgi:signal transduction histidine kinase